MKKRASIFFCLTIFAATAIAQDLHFSQYLEHPALLNPALCGAQGNLRIGAGYKDQWKSVTMPYRTMGFSVDMGRETNFRRKKKLRAGKFGATTNKKRGRVSAGLSVYRDRAGDGYMGLTQVNLSFASFVPTGNRSHLSLGIQGGLSQRSLDPNAYIFPSQYSGTGYSSGVGSGENFVTGRYTYSDYAAGMLWMYRQDEKTFVTHREFMMKCGFSVYHLLQPGRQFLNLTYDALQRKYVAHSDFIFSLSNKTGLAPSILYQLQGPSSEMIGGLMFRYYMSNVTHYTGYVNRTVLAIGGYYRTSGSIISTLLYELNEKYAVGLSYDFNLSALASAIGPRGGMEVTLRFNPPVGFLYQNR